MIKSIHQHIRCTDFFLSCTVVTTTSNTSNSTSDVGDIEGSDVIFVCRITPIDRLYILYRINMGGRPTSQTQKKKKISRFRLEKKQESICLTPYGTKYSYNSNRAGRRTLTGRCRRGGPICPKEAPPPPGGANRRRMRRARYTLARVQQQQQQYFMSFCLI